MSHFPKRRFAAALVAVAGLVVALPGMAHAGKLSWLDDLVQDVILEAKAGGKSASPRRRRCADRDPTAPAGCS